MLSIPCAVETEASVEDDVIKALYRNTPRTLAAMLSLRSCLSPATMRLRVSVLAPTLRNAAFIY